MFNNIWPFSFSPQVDKIYHPLIEKAGLSLSLLRLDLCDTITGGNKIFKLHYNLEKARQKGLKKILTFGGSYSNHIAATASACERTGFQSIGIIRGEEIENVTLNRARSQGMVLKFTSRNDYRKYRSDQNYTLLKEEFGDIYIIPEGGSNEEGVRGCEQIASFIPHTVNYIILPVGTGATMAGLIKGLKSNVEVYGIAVVKSGNALEENISAIVASKEKKFRLFHDYTFGGYAKNSSLLNEFAEEINKNYSFRIEPVYTGRAFYAVFDMITKGFFKKGDEIMLIHTGGLQYLS